MPFSRARTTVVLAMSADGKISDCDRAPARFSSASDLAHLETQVAQADAVLFGAGTLRAYGTCLSVRQPALIRQRQVAQKASQPIHIVCSFSGHLDKTLRFFQQPVPRWLLTTPEGAQLWKDAPVFDRVLSLLTSPTDWSSILMILLEAGIQHLSILGGGLLVSSLLQQDLIDELYLTICPLLIGGREAPTPVDGSGLSLPMARQLQLVTVKTIGSEVFLHYRRCNPPLD